ncbi:MAG: TauD/TfdA family dioxygenase [Lysobacterales bacterium]
MRNALLETAATPHVVGPFDLDNQAGYLKWRTTKLASRARCLADLIVDVGDPQALTPEEHTSLVERCAKWNMAVYRSATGAHGKDTASAIGRQLGLHRLHANWLADEDGISSITVGAGDHGSIVPYTNKPLKWHTDGYYHSQQQQIKAMLLHCERPAASGGENRMLDHELAYIALRDASPRWALALMADDAMTIPGREDATGMARPAQAGPVFSVDPQDGELHMRYTARTRSIAWKQDPVTLKAASFLERLLVDDTANVITLRLEPGMGIVANNVLHDRSAFVDDPARPRLIYRARYLDRVASPTGNAEAMWRNG